MIIHVKSMTKEQFQQGFFEAINVSKKNTLKLFGMSVGGTFSGSINGDSFTLVKTAGIFSNLPQRHFEGKLSYENDQLIVKGEFRFSKLYYSFLSIIGIIFLLIFLFPKNNLSTREIIKNFLLLIAFPTAFWGICRLSSLFYEKETVQLLENL